MEKPQVILLFSGKRKSGKDYICEKLKLELGDEICTIVRISGPLKYLYAENHALDFNELLSDGPYKEHYRQEMIKWSDEIREKEPGFFCKAACDQADIKPIWIISDIRRKTDISWFKREYNINIFIVRIEADESVRESRGWVYTRGVDDIASECNLDDYEDWDLVIKNNNDYEFSVGFGQLVNRVKSCLI